MKVAVRHDAADVQFHPAFGEMNTERTHDFGPGGIDLRDATEIEQDIAGLLNDLALHGVRQFLRRTEKDRAVEFDDEATQVLDAAGLNPDSVVEAGRRVFLSRTANLSRGGSAVDVTESVHPDNRVLAELAYKVEGYVDRDSKVDHLVTIERGAEIINSVIRGPAIIGEDARIVNSYVGPFTSIFHHTHVEDSEIEHSIVLDHSRIVGVPSRIEDSIIGRDVEITYSPIKPKAYKMTLGDHSKVGLL